jgi:hypothetical protein
MQKKFDPESKERFTKNNILLGVIKKVFTKNKNERIFFSFDSFKSNKFQ